MATPIPGHRLAPPCLRAQPQPSPFLPLTNGERRRARRPLIGGAWTPAGKARSGAEVRSGRPGAMGDPGRAAGGAGDDFLSQFAAELEVLAELEGGRWQAGPAPRGGEARAAARISLRRDGGPVPPRGRSAPAGAPGGRCRRGRAGAPRSPDGHPGTREGAATKRPLDPHVGPVGPLPPSTSAGDRGAGWGVGPRPCLPSSRVSPAPRVKRPRLEAVKRLNFGPDDSEEPPLPDSPPGGITPPLSPEAPHELWGDGCVAWGTGWGLGGVLLLRRSLALALGACGSVRCPGWARAPSLRVVGQGPHGAPCLLPGSQTQGSHGPPQPPAVPF